jgi:XTP/dITP diphosphohydrolase
MTEILIASTSVHKIKEFGQIFGSEIKLVSLKDMNFNREIMEDGLTFIDNSMIKCREIYNEYKKPVIADDSGLCVEALNGAPGVLSARYGGKDLGSLDKCKLLLTQLDNALSKKKQANNLNASFVCALTLYINPNRIFTVCEEFKGKISFDIRGTNGFGYDPIFFVEKYGKTVAELDDDVKNMISHRGKAAKVMKSIINTLEL